MYNLIENRFLFYSLIEKIGSNIQFANLLISKGVTEPKVSIGVKQENFLKFLDTIKQNKQIKITKTDIRLSFGNDNHKTLPFKGYKLVYQKAVFAYIAYNPVLEVMYFVDFEVPFKQFFAKSLFAQSYKLPELFGLDKPLYVGIGGNEDNMNQSLKTFFLSLANYSNMGVETQDADKVNFPSRLDINTSVCNSALFNAKHYSKFIHLENTYVTVFTNSEAGVALEQKLKTSVGVVMDSYNPVGYYTYNSADKCTVKWFDEIKTD